MITGGQSFVSAPPAFSSDSKKLLVCTGNTVSVFSTDTGMLVTELEGHADRVTSVVVVPVAAKARKFVCYCWTSSLDGTMCYWDFAAPELVKKVKVGLPIFSMVIPHLSSLPVESDGKISTLYAFISVEDIHKPAEQHKALRGQIQIYNLTNSRRVGGLLAETRKPELISMGGTGEFLGISNKRKLHIWRIPAKDTKFDDIRKIKMHHTKNLSALAFHPTERIVAGGDVTGRILIWRGFGNRNFSDKRERGRIKNEDGRPGVRDDDDADSCSTWHWHPSEVLVLFFSSDGAYLYSGGREGVLVVWQLDSGKKKFKPRLGAPLLYYTHSPDPVLSCISCADNQIHLLKMPSMEIIRSISGIKLPFSFPNIYTTSCSNFLFDHTSGLVALRTEDYCIQFFSLLKNFEISQVQICERNFQPVDETTMFVALMALSADGAMMGTVDVRLPEEGLGGLVSLKFWTHGSRIGEYNLSTVIYEPHSDSGISSLAFRPSHAMAATSSFGGEFKVWVHYGSIQPKDGNCQAHEKSGWRCQSVGSYKKMPMTAAAFSADGSVLAVAAETVVTLWDPDKNALIAVTGDTLTPITSISFVGKSEYFVTLSQSSNPQLALWDLSKLSVCWSYKLFVEAVSCMEDGSQFAILALSNSSDQAASRDQDGIILLFDVKQPIPVATWLVKKAKGGGMSFLPHNTYLQKPAKSAEETDSSLLVYINADHEFIVFDPHNSKENHISRSAHEGHLSAEEPVSAFGAIFHACFSDYIPVVRMQYAYIFARALVSMYTCEALALDMLQYMGSLMILMKRGSRLQKFHLFLQKDLGRQYSVDHPMFFHHSQSSAQYSLHLY
ncbi:WD repeat-containing protein 75 [Iris pallida]|uniref:WD repeat-containing protein 75 n=1 Tax=Iris pallida TaxID=29817 RepID=A0AAX6E1P1_IRIPA|nr:WD repeat-containing protein 75 [Iris pallida]